MLATTLIQADQLAALLRDSPSSVLVCDCSFDLANTAAGEQAFLAGHVPGAVYLNLDQALSGPKTGLNGRHPLPQLEDFVKRMAELGAGKDTQIVAYDSSGGMYAARLWWLMRWAGHRAAAVLDGGLPAWRAAGLELETGPAQPRTPGSLVAGPTLVKTVDHAQVRANIDTPASLVVDARAPDRFRGENETLDAIGGHIPGARNRLFRDNLGPDGRFKPAEQLKAEWSALTGGRPAGELINQCGSGVTACHNLLALEVAGLPGAALYPGSWSEWSSLPGSPIATGAE
ncbi:MAG TPA: sulfurtransferase [Ideonella sp.]|nr:sulfurtransferase [Ideonella sp.]